MQQSTLLKPRVDPHRPRAVVGVTLARSTKFVKETAYYDSVLTYDQLENDGKSLPSSVSADAGIKIVIVNSGAPDEAAKQWHKAAQGVGCDVKSIALASEAKATEPDDTARFFEEVTAAGWVFANALGMRSRAYEIRGE